MSSGLTSKADMMRLIGLRQHVTLFAPATVRIKFIDGVLPSDDLVREPDPAVRADVDRSRKTGLSPFDKAWCGRPGRSPRSAFQDLLFKTCFSFSMRRGPATSSSPLVFSRLSSVISGSHNPNILLAPPAGRCEARSRRETARLLPGSDFPRTSAPAQLDE